VPAETLRLELRNGIPSLSHHASNEAKADSLGPGEQSKEIRDCWVVDRRMLWHR